MDESKTCKDCGEREPLTAFYKAAGCVDGRRGECATCFQEGGGPQRGAPARHRSGPAAAVLHPQRGHGHVRPRPGVLIEAADYLLAFAALDAEEREESAGSDGGADATVDGEDSR